MAAMDLLEDAEIQHVHQRCGVSALARISSACFVSASAASEYPSNNKSNDLQANSRRRPLVRSALLDDDARRDGRAQSRDRGALALPRSPGVKQRHAFEAMADHAGPGRALLFRQRQELDGELLNHVPVECDEVRDPGAVKHDKQQE